MSIIAKVRFAHDDGALAPTFSNLPDLSATVVREASTEPGRRVYLFRFEDEDPTELRRTLEADHTVGSVERLSGFESQNLWGVEFVSEAKLLNPRVTSEDGLVLDARSSNRRGTPRGWLERWLLPDRASLRGIWQYARGEGFSFEVLEFRTVARTGQEYPGATALTARQRETLVAAYERGYFAEPRETSLKELGESFDRSSTAVAGRLRRGMKSLVGMTVDGVDG